MAADSIKSARIDKWLWAARFYKTRQLAIDAINAGHVSVNQERVKPARNVKAIDRILIKKPPFEFHIIVIALAEKRGSATIAQTLYTETVAGKQARESLAEELKRFPPSPFKGRPSKKDRRDLEKFSARLSGSETGSHNG